MSTVPAGTASARRAGLFTLLAVLAAAASLAFLVYRRKIAPAGPLAWDEGYHALHALRAAVELREGSFLRLAYDAYRSVYWPPLHALYVGALFLLFGATAEVARASSLPALVAAAGLLAASALRTRGTAAALVAGFGFLLSPAIPYLSGSAYLELPALALLTLSLLLYVSGRHPVLLGLSVFATYLARTNYGVLLALGLAVALAVDAAPGRRLPPGDPRLAARRDALRTLAALAVPLALWFAYPPKIVHTLAALVNLPTGPSAFGAEGLLYYPRAAVRLAGSGPLLAFYVAALVLSFSPRWRRDRNVRLVAILALLQIVLAEISQNKLSRHILPLAVLLPFLLGVSADDLWARSRTAVRGAMAGVFVLLLALQLPALAAAFRTATPRGGEAVLAAVVEKTSGSGRTVFVASEAALVPPATCDFTLLAGGVVPLEGLGSLRTASEQRLAESAAALPGPLARIVREEAGRWPGAASYSVYVGIPRGDAALRWTPENFPGRLAALLTRAPVDRVVALSDPEGRSFPLTPAYLESALSGLGFALESSVRPSPGTALLTFRKVMPPAPGPAPGPPAP